MLVLDGEVQFVLPGGGQPLYLTLGEEVLRRGEVGGSGEGTGRPQARGGLILEFPDAVLRVDATADMSTRGAILGRGASSSSFRRLTTPHDTRAQATPSPSGPQVYI